MSNDDSKPRTRAILLRQSDEEREELDDLARRTKRSRAWVMRRALARFAAEVRTGRRTDDE